MDRDTLIKLTLIEVQILCVWATVVSEFLDQQLWNYSSINIVIRIDLNLQRSS